MPTSISPRSRDSLEFIRTGITDEEPHDPRFDDSLSSLSLGSDYEENTPEDDARPLSAGSGFLSRRRERRSQQRQSSLDHIVSFSYDTVADGETIRLAVIRPGIGNDPVECELRYVSYKKPQLNYSALSYCWEGNNREAAIICDGRKFDVTANLLSALQSLRQRDLVTVLWVDQLCICQDDPDERSHQVSLMKYIYSNAREVIVWLGEKADRSDELFQYARKMRRGEEASQTAQLNRILPAQQRKKAVQKLLRRPWFYRVWTIQEVALSQFVTVACGSSRLSWDNLVRLIKDVHLPEATGFDKTTALLGNTRQRIAILTQMAASQKASLAHADITQLLILAKGSRATNARDMIYAFYGLTHVTTYPDYSNSVEKLYIDIAEMYINSILFEESYAAWHGLSDEQKTQQLLSILYSAGALSQDLHLPSWVPDWTYPWHVRPLWCQATINAQGFGRNNWTSGLRSEHRAGGEKVDTFEVLRDTHGHHRLRLTAKLFDTVSTVTQTNPSPDVKNTGLVAKISSIEPWYGDALYGRRFFTTERGAYGIALPEIKVGDTVAVLLGGDVPVILRHCRDRKGETYKLLCECYIRSESIMQGECLENQSIRAMDIVLV